MIIRLSKVFTSRALLNYPATLCVAKGAVDGLRSLPMSYLANNAGRASDHPKQPQSNRNGQWCDVCTSAKITSEHTK